MHPINTTCVATPAGPSPKLPVLYEYRVPSSSMSVVSGSPWRPRRPPRKCDLASGCLHREGCDLCQHRRPAAAHQRGCAHAWRLSGGLEDHPSAQRGKTGRFCTDAATVVVIKAPTTSGPRAALRHLSGHGNLLFAKVGGLGHAFFDRLLWPDRRVSYTCSA